MNAVELCLGLIGQFSLVSLQVSFWLCKNGKFNLKPFKHAEYSGLDYAGVINWHTQQIISTQALKKVAELL